MRGKLALLALICNFSITGCKTGDVERSYFSSFDGTKIAYTFEGEGSTVVLIHGFIVDGNYNWGSSELRKQLLNEGYRVVIPDLRGNGSSEKPLNEEAYKNNAEVKDLMALMDHLEVETYKAVGYSRGSIVLAKLLTMDKRINRAVFGGMGLDFTNPAWDRRVEFGNVFSGRTEPDELTEGAVDFARDLNVDFRIMGYLQDHQPETTIAELNTIDIETLVISGNDDLDNGNPEDLKNALPHSRLRIVDGNHMSTFNSKGFAEAILDFLEEE